VPFKFSLFSLFSLFDSPSQIMKIMKIIEYEMIKIMINNEQEEE
jgi:hypothetical protein